MTQNAFLAVNNATGIYNAQTFIYNFLTDMCIGDTVKYKEEIEDIQNGPDNEFYIDSWITVSENCRIKLKGIIHHIHENDGDIWLVPENELNQLPQD